MKHLKLYNDYILESYNRTAYFKWKRKNVSLRGINVDDDKPLDEPNNGMGILGTGLYSVPPSNMKMAKGYGKVYYLLNAIPKNPKIINTFEDAKNWIYLQIRELGYKNSQEFYDGGNTINKMMEKLGFDGITIKGREYVNYKPKDVMYFENERQLENYYDFQVETGKIT